MGLRCMNLEGEEQTERVSERTSHHANIHGAMMHESWRREANWKRNITSCYNHGYEAWILKARNKLKEKHHIMLSAMLHETWRRETNWKRQNNIMCYYHAAVEQNDERNLKARNKAKENTLQTVQKYTEFTHRVMWVCIPKKLCMYTQNTKINWWTDYSPEAGMELDVDQLTWGGGLGWTHTK